MAIKRISLFHATNAHSADLMLKHGMGLDAHDYERMRSQVAHEFGLPVARLESIQPGDADSTEVQGGVSFFPTLQQAVRIVDYGLFGGEFRGSFVEHLTKRACRLCKIPYATKKGFVQKMVGGHTASVVVEVLLPVELVHNIRAIGTSSEHYTVQKVPAEFITHVHFAKA